MSSSTDVFIGNHHSAPIIFQPRAKGGETLLSTRVVPPAIVIEAGESKLVPADVWAEEKKKRIVQGLLDIGVLTIERGEKEVPISFDSAGAHPEPPEHLAQEEFSGTEAPVSARVRKAKVGSLTM